MNRFLIISILFFCSLASSQTTDAINWINGNSINLEDLSVDHDLPLKELQLSTKFVNARIYGFGEATHHNKEFFELKSSFFKFLVLNHGVKIFVLEESFGASFDINQYINGNDGDLKDLVLNFRQHIWKTEEIYDLIKWMRDYNSIQDDDKKIKFFGNDCMFNYKLVPIIKEALQKDKIIINSAQIELLNYFAAEIFTLDSNLDANRFRMQIAKDLISDIRSNPNAGEELLRAIGVFSHYLNFLTKPTQITRDKFMAETVEKIYTHQNNKIFIWAHNEHVKKTTLFREETPTMGNLLYHKFSDAYYSMGFEFGIGTLWGFDQKEKKSENTILYKPVKGTNSEFLFESNLDALYFDFSTAAVDQSMKKFLDTKRKYLVIGGYGFVPKYLKYQIASERYIDMFDGLIYVKSLTRSTPLK